MIKVSYFTCNSLFVIKDKKREQKMLLFYRMWYCLNMAKNTTPQEEIQILLTIIEDIDSNEVFGTQMQKLFKRKLQKIQTSLPKTSLLNIKPEFKMETIRGAQALFVKLGDEYKLVYARNIPAKFEAFVSTSAAAKKRYETLLNLLKEQGTINPFTGNVDYEGTDFPACSASTIASIVAGRTVNGKKTIKPI